MSGGPWRTDPDPGGAVLSNGTYWSLFTRRGTGTAFARWHDEWLQAYAWRPDIAQDDLGWLFYLRDLDGGVAWSIGPNPCPHPQARYRFRRRAGVAVLESRTAGLHAQLQAWVDVKRPQEYRRLWLQNTSERASEIEVTTYLEVVLFPFAAFVAHPAFAKLFVQTAWLPEEQCLAARRRPRSAEEHWPLLFLATLSGNVTEYETDRLRFLGRGCSTRAPQWVSTGEPLAGATGSVLDPVFSLRHVVRLAPGDATTLEFVCGLAEDETQLMQRFGSGELRDLVAARRAAERRHRRVLRESRLKSQDAKRADAIALALLYRSPELRSPLPLDDPVVARRVRSELGLAGDRVLVVAAENEDWWACVGRYWQSCGLPIDVVVARAQEQHVSVTPVLRPAGGVVLSAEEFAALLAIADGCFPGARGKTWSRARDYQPERAATERRSRELRGEFRGLKLWNGFGGFSSDGREYVLPVGEGHGPPLPWVNVIANPEFGCLVSERGAGFTWSRNSREFRLSVWSNDPVIDPPSECLYLRDEETGSFWSLLPAPCGMGTFAVAHGQGFSRWNHTSSGLEATVTCFVPPDQSLRVWWIEIVNRTAKGRRLSLWAYHQLVLGADPWTQRSLVVTELAHPRPIVWARTPAVELLERRQVFAALVAERAWVRSAAGGDRLWFVGAGGSLAAPVVLRRREWRNGPTGAGLDPGAVVAGEFRLAAGERWQGALLLGETEEREQAVEWIQDYRDREHVRQRLEATQQFWQQRLSELRVETPWPGLNALVNHWLLYQATSCRLWGRSAFYQSGGAWGFRDQLQDACALLWSRPEETRAQILLHAAHQFPEGDVLHWWHPPWEKGTRTRFSDDLLWLPLVVAWYVEFTGDSAVLDERAPFVCARPLAPGEDEAYLAVKPSAEQATLYEHCCRALDRSLTRGPHGLPLMGTGDWNDGMNRVGRKGQGESVWLGFFLAEVLARFQPFCEARGDRERAERYRDYRRALVEALETHGWDGAWYRRAYFDDGTPLGSAQNPECQVDALVQAWAVLSGVASPDRARQALAAVENRLVDAEAQIVRLLFPPFDRMPQDPGYIKGYVPGIRENGGQYTHAAIWVVQAFLRAGLVERASALLRALLPTEHARDEAAVGRYKVEPYVVAADIYGEDPHRGRGGWTWYTGSAGWLYRLVVECFLGIRLEHGTTLVVEPHIPPDWHGFRAFWRVPQTKDLYSIEVEQRTGAGVRPIQAWLDGKPLDVIGNAVRLPLCGDKGEHHLKIVLQHHRSQVEP